MKELFSSYCHVYAVVQKPTTGVQGMNIIIGVVIVIILILVAITVFSNHK